MSTPSAPRRGGRVLRLVIPLLLCLVGTAALLRAALPALVESSPARRLVVRLLESRTGLDASLGSITYAGKGTVVLTGLSLSGTGRPQVQLPFVELHLSGRGLARRRVDEVVLSGPVFHVAPGQGEKKDKGIKPEGAPGIPPVGRLRIISGVVRIEGKARRAIVVGPVSGTLERNPEGLVAITGVAALPFVKRPLVFETALDPGKFSLTDAELSVEDILISDLSKKGTLRGNLDLYARLLAVTEGGVEIELRGKVRDLVSEWIEPGGKVLSGRLDGNILVEDSHRTVRGTGGLELFQPDRSDERHTMDIEVRYARDRRFMEFRCDANLKDVPPFSFQGSLSDPGAASSRFEGILKIPRFAPRHLKLIAGRASMPLPAGILTGATELQGSGTLEARLKLLSREEGSRALSADVDLRVEEGGFASSDGARAAEGIRLESSARVNLSLPGRRGSYGVQGQAGGFELLVDRFYGDFRDRKLRFSASGSIGGGDHDMTAEKAMLDLEGLGRVSFSGLIAGHDQSSGARGSLIVDASSHSAAFDLFVRETFGESLPWIRGLTLDGRSRLEAEIKWKKKEGFNIKGDLEIFDTNVRSEELALEWNDVNASLPLVLAYPGKGIADARPRAGDLRWEELKWGSVRIPQTSLRPIIRQNGLSLPEEITIPVWGGEARLSGVSFSGLSAANRVLRLEARVRGVDLARLSDAAGLPPVQGTIGGELPFLTYREGSLRTEGALKAELFGGQMTATAITADGLWGPVPSFGLSLELREIDLGRVTEALAFGRITGIVEGSVKDLVITAGQAQHFDARLETVKRRNVGQKISVEALEKISILGSGEQAGILSRGIYQFFEEYRYAKMGFAATLVNDHLTLTGIGQEGNRTYLVRGGVLPPRAEVITYSQDISFSEMVKRLKRVGRISEEKPEPR